MRQIYFLSSVFLVLFFCSCTTPKYTVFSEDLKKENRWSDRQLGSIQYYVSKDIVLFRANTMGESEIVNGKVVMKKGEKVQKIVIKRGTPGQLVYNPKYDRFGVSFDQDSKDNFLMFGPNQNDRGEYMLLAKEWQDGYGLITYGDQEYRTSSASAYAALMIELDKTRKIETKTTEVGGRSVSKN